MPSPQPAGAPPRADDPSAALRAHAGAIMRLLDDAGGLPTLERLRLVRELAGIRADLDKGPDTLARLKLAKRLSEIRLMLGVRKAAAPANDDKAAPTPHDDVAEGRAERRSTSHLYDYDPNRKPAQRKRENAAAMDLLRRIDAGELRADALTDEQRAALARYSGTGGNLVGADGKKGSAYEYYTPKPIAEGMWGLLRELGFSGGRTLDPSSGVGIFSATAPVNAAMDAIELSETSGRVNQIVNDGPGHGTTIAPFEQVAAATPDETYDAVITNVPFGGVEDRGGNQFKDTKYRNEPLQNYFILRSLEKLRPGGLAAFITPPRCVSGKGGKEQDLRERVSYMAEFLGAYRLPNSVFGTAAADTITDVIVFRKFDRATLDKVAELREQNPGVLAEANVVWSEFIEGRYFSGEGRRFILGEFVAKDPNKFRDVDRVVNNGSIADIAKLLRKFGDSRIRWDLLETAETTPIVYREGDTLQHAGQTLRMENGRWVVLKQAGDDEAKAQTAELLAKLSTALGAVNAGVSHADAVRLRDAMIESAQALEIPDWLRGLLAQLDKVDAAQRADAWAAATVGLAINEAMEERQAEETGFNYLEGYPTLSAAMPRVLADAKRPPTALAANVKTAMKAVAIHFDKVNGYSGVWRGDVAAAVDDRTESQKFEAARYQSGGGAFVPMDEARRVFGEGFDPMADDDWCVSADGQGVAKADDYFVGNYADFLARIDKDLAAATDDTVRAKLVRQKLVAESRLLRTDPAAIDFNLFSPFVTLEERAEFLRRFVDPRFAVGFDDKTGDAEIVFELVGQPKNARDKLLKRFAMHLNGTRLTLGGAEVGDEKKALAYLKRMADTANAQFNSWAKSNPAIMGRLRDVANDPQRLYFRAVDDESPLDIPGLNLEWSSHGYQNAWVRRMGREFGGINGDGVGLGKTSQSLIAVQHAQSIGVKRKTVFVVPNSVLSNWRKESRRVYASIDDCLFVGLREVGDGKFRTDPGAYDADLTRVLENKHRKIFMTYEAFARLRLRASTAEAYDAYLASVDSSYEASDRKAEDEKKKSRRAALIDMLTTDKAKSMAAPFFEDLGIDSLVIDEAHMLKNSRATVEFKGGKFLSLAEPSARGLDAQAKAWFVRRDTPRKDGVILLTATPITNSPLEIYSMLSLAMGDAKLNDMMLGVKGADDFMTMMCEIEEREEETLDGNLKMYPVFTGLRNVSALRNALAAAATMRTAEQVGAQIIVPTAEEKAAPVVLPPEVNSQLQEYKDAFRFAIDTLFEKKDVGGSEAAYEAVAARFGEPMELIGHPFNLINKMSMLIADPELDQRAAFYTVSPAQRDKAAELVSKWNTKPPVEDRPRPGPHTSEVAIVGKKKIKDGDDTTELLRIQARAKLDGDRLILDSMDPAVHAAFDALAEKVGVDLDVSVPPKLAALIENFQHEEANPRGRVAGMPSGRVRQIVFCDVLALHSKIKRVVSSRCGVAASSIAIITGRVNGKPEEILAVQDGFNAEGEDNRYRCVIANEKAEVGINLQKGTQAMHHLTIGWTPDSLTQRNGRGVRQGNETQSVRVYYYDADGTFDTYKRMLVGKKSSWIDEVTKPDGGNSVSIATGLSREQLEALIDSVGDKDAMSRIQARADMADRLAREASTQGKQVVNIQTVRAQRLFMAKYPDARAWVADKVVAYAKLQQQVTLVQSRIANPKATASAVLKNQNTLAELKARLDGLARDLAESVTVERKESYNANSGYTPSTIEEFVSEVRGSMRARDDLAEKLTERFKSPWGFRITVDETSGFGNEWRSEVDMAQAMIDESRRDFERLAKEAGGYSAEVMARVDSNEVTIVDGKVACAGAFLATEDGLAVVARTNQGMVAQFLREDGTTRRISVADAMRKGTLVLPGAATYGDMVRRAAEIEDVLADAGGVLAGARDALFSAVVPEVAQRRTKALPVTYAADGWEHYTLPAPYFPNVIGDVPPDVTAPLATLVRKQQAAVVIETKAEHGRLTFTCDSSVAVAKIKNSSDFPWNALLDLARAHGMKLTLGDFDVFKGSQYAGWTRIMLNEKRGDYKAAIAAATTVDELGRLTRAWLAEEAYPQFDMGSLPAINTEGILREADFNASVAYSLAVRRLTEAAKPAPAANDATPSPEPAAEEPADTDPNRMVGISGNTRKWKDQIKSAAARAGGRAIWDGNAECWNVPFRAWAMLTESYPAAGQELNVVESSGKTSYGRRRYR